MKTGLTRNEERVDHLFERISRLIEQARSFVVTSVNKAEVRTRFEVGRYIFEDEQQGERAEYGKRVLKKLSDKLTNRYGKDWTVDTLTRCRKFYMTYSTQRQILATTLPKSQNKIRMMRLWNSHFQKILIYMLLNINSICPTRLCFKTNCGNGLMNLIIMSLTNKLPRITNEQG